MSSVKGIKVAHESSSNDSSSSSHDIKHINELPQELFQHCLEFVGKGNFAFVAPVSKHFYWNYISMGVPIKNNMLTVDTLLQLGRNKYTSAEAIATGSMRLATECFLKAPQEFKEAVCRYAAVNGRLDILNCGVALGVKMREEAFDWTDDDATDWYATPLLEQVMLNIVVNGHLDVIQFLYKEGIDFDDRFDLFEEVVDKGHAKALHWMYTKGIISLGRTKIATFLARGGELDILKEYYKDYISKEDCIFSKCAKGGHVEVMNWMLDVAPEECDWNELLFCAAAESGSIPMMELCLRMGCPKSPRVCMHTMINKKKEIAFNALKWLRQNNIPWDERLCAYAACNRNLEALKWARENGCPWDIKTFEESVLNGDIAFLDYCFENNCPSDSSLYRDVLQNAKSNEFKVYQWLLQHSIPMDEKTSYHVGFSRQLSTLKLVIDHGCPIDHDMLRVVISFGNLHILDYLVKNYELEVYDIYRYSIEILEDKDAEIIEVLQLFRDNNIPWNNEIIPFAQRLRRTNVVRWLKCNGCSDHEY